MLKNKNAASSSIDALAKNLFDAKIKKINSPASKRAKMSDSENEANEEKMCELAKNEPAQNALQVLFKAMFNASLGNSQPLLKNILPQVKNEADENSGENSFNEEGEEEEEEEGVDVKGEAGQSQQVFRFQ